ncbi:MAG: hypothetical protein V1773_10665 [bacterium]
MMCRKFLYLASVLSIVLFISCEDSLEPNGEYSEGYSLNCILRCDSNAQYVVLSKSYLPDNSDPYSYNTDPIIYGADVRIYYDDEAVIFKDSSVARSDTSRYKTPYGFYFSNQFKPAVNKEFEIDVLLPNGRRLKATTITPNTVEFQKTSCDLIITKITKEKGSLNYYWRTLARDIFYVPRLTFTYYKNLNGVPTKYSKSIPIKYRSNDGIYVPLYPQPDKNPYVFYNMDAVIKAFEDISEGDAFKGNYSVVASTTLELIILDKNLSGYYSSSTSAYGEFSVKIDESDYTNITNGYGIFGSYLKQEIRVSFTEDFINSFGYSMVYN